jgi:hypothetical protein
MSVSTRFCGLAATAAIALAGFAVAPSATADETTEPVPCASQQAKVDKAEDALERVTAEAGREKALARKALSKAKDVRDETKVTKRAQQQRLVKAEERLATCEAEQVTPTPTPTETPTTTV